MKTLSIFHHPIIRIIPIGLLAKYYELFTLKSNYFTIYKTPALDPKPRLFTADAFFSTAAISLRFFK